ncbi:MAG TPA: serine/threonine-protein kinase [Kofleriaceae bacterium]
MTDDDQATDQEPDVTKREGVARRPAPKNEKLARGTSVGRYMLLDIVGEGGMGIVYAAYDPELDRRVAIKLLQAMPAGDSTGGSDQAWLLREAQAMARLSHPNVIAVHDVGLLSGDRVFVAMELVDGMTLRAWLKENKRTWQEVVHVMAAAGNGLAAAHAAGLVHRDFKPDNVLIGRDGRVRVMDFGLARLQAEESLTSRISDSNIEARSPLSANLTLAGSVVGTPAYIAPELRQGQAAGARSDQFSFGIALYEALYRVRPFKSEDLKEGTNLPRPKPPQGTGIPARIERAVLRALAFDPEDRFANMQALTAELATDPKTTRRTVVIASAIAVAGAGALTLALLTGSGDRPCSGVERRLNGVWNATTKRDVRAAFVATKLPLATRIFDSVELALDRYAKEWTVAVVESCEATRIRGEQTEEVLSLRQDCLDQRLEELRAFTQLLAKPDETIVEKSGAAALALESIRKCANVAELRAPGQPPAEARAKVEAVIGELSAAKAGLITAKLGTSINRAQAAADAAKAIPFMSLEAEARLVLGLAQYYVGNPIDAEVNLESATWLGVRARRDDVVIQAALGQALIAAESQDRVREAKVWFELGDAAAARTGFAAHELRRLEVKGIIAGHQNDRPTAIAAHQQALATAIRMWGPDAPLVGNDEQLLAATLLKAEDYTGALPHYERALVLMEKTLGPVHPDLAPILNGLASCYHLAGKRDQAKVTFERALAIQEQMFGSDSLNLVPTLNNNAELLRDEGDAVLGLPMIERAKVIAEKTVGKRHPFWHNVATTHAELFTVAKRFDDARKQFDEVLEIEERARSAYKPYTLHARAKLALAEKKWLEAASFAERSIAAYEASTGAESLELWRPLASLAQARHALGKTDEARKLYARAVATAEKAKVRDKELAVLRDAIAKLSPD